MVVGQGQVHHRADLDLAVDSDRALLDGMQAEHSTLGQVDDRSTHEGAKDTAVADGEGTTSHVFDGELAITGLDAGGKIAKLVDDSWCV